MRVLVTPPRQIVPGKTVMVTCRAVGRSFRFVPNPKVVQTLLYCFAYELSQHEIDVHEFVWMSNHFHVVLTPRSDALPDFMKGLNSLASRALNSLRGWSGSNFEKRYNITVASDPDKVLDHCAYTLANPCSAHLVTRAEHWKGLTSAKLEYGEVIRVERPRFGLWSTPKAVLERVHRRRSRRPRSARPRSHKRAAYRGRWKTPDEVNLQLTRPKVHVDLSDTELREEVRRRMVRLEAKAEDERRTHGRRVLGMRRVAKQHWNDIPREREDMFGPEPKASGSSKWARIEVLQANRRFVTAYRAAVEAFMAGDREVVFPRGTWLMRRRYAVACATSPP